MNSLTQQKGGSHYVDLPIQPVQFIAANGWDFFSANILKYITRWRSKNGVGDLEKALHYAHLRIELDAEIPWPPEAGRHRKPITVSEFVQANGIQRGDDPLFYALEMWVTAGRRSTSARAMFITHMENFIQRAKDDAAGLPDPDLFV